MVKTYRDVLDAYLFHPESKSMGPDGKPCGRATRGVLDRRPVTCLGIAYIGKESNKLEEGQMGLIHKIVDVLTEFPKFSCPWESYVVPVLKEIPVPVLMDESGLSRRTIQRLRNGHSRPQLSHEALLTHIAAIHARSRLRENGRKPPVGDIASL